MQTTLPGWDASSSQVTPQHSVRFLNSFPIPIYTPAPDVVQSVEQRGSIPEIVSSNPIEVKEFSFPGLHYSTPKELARRPIFKHVSSP